MFVLKGKYTAARIMIDYIEETATTQIYKVLNHPAFKGTSIAIMPDAHAGAGCVIGYTQTMNDYVVANLVGVDIGCGVYAYNLGQREVDFGKFDRLIRENIPSGFSVREKQEYLKLIPTKLISEIDRVCGDIGESSDNTIQSIGTLGGGNHYIELNKDPDENVWLCIHSGSRHFGLAVAQYHQNKAKELMIKMFHGASAYKELEFLPMNLGGAAYIRDMKVAQWMADENRKLMAHIMLDDFFDMDDALEYIRSVHNYIGDDNIIRKGAISANEGERLIIPLNMRDGAIVGTGKGSKKWNNSAPHGAGRNMSRSSARKKFTLEEFKEEMEGIWSSCIKTKTIDESPMAYKDASDILDNIDETVDVEFVMKPIYNFKATS